MKYDVFISYRRSDTRGFANALYEKMQYEFNTFLDSSEISQGSSWPDTLKNTLAEVQVILVIIGQNWNLERLQNEGDWVLKEIETAKQLKKCIIPILVDNASMPKAEDLPESIKDLPHFQGTKIINYSSDISWVIHEINKVRLENELGSPAKKLHEIYKDRYKVEKLLSDSRRATIYIAKDRKLDRKVVFRVFKEEGEEGSYRDKIMNAIDFTSTFPNCVPIFDADFERLPHIMLRHMPGGSLRGTLEDNPNGLPEPKAARIIRDIGEVLIKANTTHCNIKPSNILLNKGNAPFINPFNRIKRFEQEKIIKDLEKRKSSKNLDKTEFKEDFHYLAPEIFSKNFKGPSDNQALQKIDQYMLGLLGYELVFGATPKIYATVEDLHKLKTDPAIIKDIIKRINQLQECENEKLNEALRTMISINPNDRFPDLITAINEINKSLIEVADIEVVRKSYLRCLGNKIKGKGFFETFYEAFTKDKSIKKRFKKFDVRAKDHHSMQRQYSHLQGALFGLIEYANETLHENAKDEIRILEHMAKRHGKGEGEQKKFYIDVKPEHFDFFLETLLETVCGNPKKEKEPFDSTSNRSENRRKRIRATWKKVLAPGIKFMKTHLG